MSEANNNANKKVILVLGPTGSGKTKLAFELGKESDRYELINGDSMQVYKEIQIGNNKEKLPEGVIAWLFDVVSVRDDFSVYDYQILARQAIDDIHSRGKIPVIVGGSGLYIHAAVYDYKFQGLKKDNFSDDVKELQRLLIEKDFDLGKLNDSDRNNPRRLQSYLRKLEAGFEPDNLLGDQSKRKPLYDLDVRLLDIDLKVLRENLIKRIDEMFENGLLDEVKMLIEMDKEKPVSSQVKSASGYKQVFEYLSGEGEMTTDELKERILFSHYQLAKKQITWNKKYFNHFQ